MMVLVPCNGDVLRCRTRPAQLLLSLPFLGRAWVSHLPTPQSLTSTSQSHCSSNGRAPASAQGTHAQYTQHTLLIWIIDSRGTSSMYVLVCMHENMTSSPFSWFTILIVCAYRYTTQYAVYVRVWGKQCPSNVTCCVNAFVIFIIFSSTYQMTVRTCSSASTVPCTIFCVCGLGWPFLMILWLF